jgi:hypothetical protein
MNGKKARELRKKAELRDVDVIWISLLWDDMFPSNEENAIIKADGVKEFKVEITKVDEIEGIVHGIAMKGNSIDTQGDWYSNETVKKTGRKYIDFLVDLGVNEPSDTNHNMKSAKGIKLVDSHIDESDPESVKWRIAIDINGNAEAMQKAKDKAITGFSIYGYATRVQKSDESFLSTIKSTVKDAFLEFWHGKKGDTAENFSEINLIGDIYSATRAFHNALIGQEEDTWEEFIKVDTQEDYLKNVEQLYTILKEINIETKKGEGQMNFDEIMATDEGKTAFKEFVATDEAKTLIDEAGYEITPKAEPDINPDEGNTVEAQKQAIANAKAEGIKEAEAIAKAKADEDKIALDKANAERDALKKKVDKLEKTARSTSDLIPPPKGEEDEETVDDIIKDEKKKALDKAQGVKSEPKS